MNKAMTEDQSPQTENKRSILAIYYEDWKARKIVKQNRGANAENMALLCHKHMRKNDYSALLVEVFSEVTGEVETVVKRHANGEISVVYNRAYMGGL